MRHFDGWQTMEGRHLVFAYAAVLIIQGGYFAWIVGQWRKLSHNEKAAKPV